MVDRERIFTAACYARLEKGLLLHTDNTATLYHAIVNIPFDDKLLTTTIDLGIVVLLRVNPQTKTIDRVALSNTELANNAVRVSAKPFHRIRIPLDAADNIIAQAIARQKPMITEDWPDLFTPALSHEAARLNQVAASIESSMVWPLACNPGGALIFSFYQPKLNIGSQHKRFTRRYAALVGNALTANSGEVVHH